jgi:O-methyltransferase involved in polyketide biosynthesis
MTTTPIQDVSETALMVVVWRAHENDHPKPLYRDPFALKLAGERGKQIAAHFPKIRKMISCWMMAIRTRIIDELIEHAADNGVDTVLNLGAGLDTRPYRLNLPKELPEHHRAQGKPFGRRKPGLQTGAHSLQPNRPQSPSRALPR